MYIDIKYTEDNLTSDQHILEDWYPTNDDTFKV